MSFFFFIKKYTKPARSLDETERKKLPGTNEVNKALRLGGLQSNSMRMDQGSVGTNDDKAVKNKRRSTW